jgi:hypothetical protein
VRLGVPPHGVDTALPAIGIVMTVLCSIGLFVLAAIAEIGPRGTDVGSGRWAGRLRAEAHTGTRHRPHDG